MAANPINELMGKHRGHRDGGQMLTELVALEWDEMAIDGPWKFRVWYVGFLLPTWGQHAL